MTILRDFFGQPLKVGDRVAFMPASTRGWSGGKLGTIKAIAHTTDRYGRPQTEATIEREVYAQGHVCPETGKWVQRTKMADHTFVMDGRPVFKAPDEASEDTVLVPTAVLHALRRDEAKLAALEGHGVDNWQGYEDAMASLDTEDFDPPQGEMDLLITDITPSNSPLMGLLKDRAR